MRALDELLKLGNFPAARDYESVRHGEHDHDSLCSCADAALEELADKLAKSIEWGNIERRRKEKAEERAEQAEFFARGWHRQFSRVNKARHAEVEMRERAEQERDYYRECYQLLLQQRNEAEAELGQVKAKLSARELDREGYMRRIQLAEAEVARMRHAAGLYDAERGERQP